MVDIQYSITIMGGREVSRPYQVWFFAEGELFFMFLFQSPSIFPLNRFIRLHGVNHNQPFPTANQELSWSVSSFFSMVVDGQNVWFLILLLLIVQKFGK